jgi:hypothetical protein
MTFPLTNGNCEVTIQHHSYHVFPKEKKMLEYQASTTIKASAASIWKILTDGAHYPEWDPYAEKIEGKIAAGEQIKAFSKLSPGRAFPVKVSVFEPNKKMSWSSGMPLGLFKGERTFTLKDLGNGKVEFTVREEFTGLMLPLIDRTIPDMNEPFQAFVNGLKKRAENG